MEGAPCVNLTDAVRSVLLLKINGHLATRETPLGGSVASVRTTVAGHDWVVDYYPFVCYNNDDWIKLAVTLASDGKDVVASFAFRVVDQAGHLAPSRAAAGSATLGKGQSRAFFLMSRANLHNSGYLRDDSFVIECAITVLLDGRREPKEAAAASNAAPPVGAGGGPSSDMQRHFGELLRSQKGADVTFLVAGEEVAAHKCVLAARSPVFMAELFGGMREDAAAPRVEVEDMEPEVFRELVRFIYTDEPPELGGGDGREAMAQHLLAAADRYGMERLKLICEEKVCADVGIGNVAAALALAEQHGCAKLKARCMEFAVATPANLRAVVATEGYKHLLASCPTVMSELLVAVVDKYK
ncbi:hypothetical protein ACP4OV_013586 [Aristida adscensionis]